MALVAGDGKTMWGVRKVACCPCPSGKVAAKKGSQCRSQDKAKEQGEERQFLALLVKMKGLIQREV